MKITKIKLQGFRAFDEPFELDLDGGKNLLMYGENGSGKSSIYLALKRFLEERGDDIGSHRNHFSPETRDSHVRVCFNGMDATAVEGEFCWDVAGGHPLLVPDDSATAPISQEHRSLLVDGARRAGFLDYRAMLRTHLLASPLSRTHNGPRIHDIIYGSESQGFEEQLFDLVSLVVLSGVRTTVAGGGETTIGELTRNVWKHRPANRRPEQLTNANTHANTFNQAFNAKLPELEAKLSEFLNHFANHQLSVTFQQVALAWDKPSLKLEGAKLVPQVAFREQSAADYQSFLNEARLSALAICLFFAGVVLSDNDFDNPDHPRLLFLDDALIGLDHQNRLPILHILASDAFKHYQIFLFTHDRVWYDLARGHLTEKDGWLHRELLADDDMGRLIPRHRSSQSDLDQARKHLKNGDLKAAAVYARSAFEWKLRNVCEKHGIKVPFKPEANRVGAGVLWDGIIQRQRDRESQRAKGSPVSDFVPQQLEKPVETMRSTVLNKLSHSGSSGLVQAEVQAAIETIDNLHKHQFPK